MAKKHGKYCLACIAKALVRLSDLLKRVADALAGLGKGGDDDGS